MADCDLIVHKPVVQRLQEDGTLIWLGLGGPSHVVHLFLRFCTLTSLTCTMLEQVGNGQHQSNVERGARTYA